MSINFTRGGQSKAGTAYNDRHIDSVIISEVVITIFYCKLKSLCKHIVSDINKDIGKNHDDSTVNSNKFGGIKTENKVILACLQETLH